jgi:hypothetical protein
MQPNRYEQGLAKLREIDGEADQRVVDSLADITPDFARYLLAIFLAFALVDVAPRLIKHFGDLGLERDWHGRLLTWWMQESLHF